MSSTLRTTYAALPSTTRGQPVHLGGDPKNGKKFLYCNGNSVITRDLENPMISETYNEHSTTTTVARLSPSGFYCASADASGKIRIWDTVNPEHIMKAELRPISGVIKDLQWSEDSKRIAVAGEGRDTFGAVVMWDTGSSVGEISGHSKPLNSIDFKQTRPYRVATVGEDFSNGFFPGPPFKFDHVNKDHTRFANCVRFSPDGSKYATCGSDQKIYLYNGSTGEKLSELGSPAHGGSVMSMSWSSDSTKLLSASADKTCKLWDVGANSVTSTFTIGGDVGDQQLGCLWQGNHMISVSLCGFINYLDANDSSKPSRILKGHTKSVTALTTSGDGKTFYSGSYDGRISRWDVATGENSVYAGVGHSNQVVDISVHDDKLFTAGMDDTVRVTPAAANDYSSSVSCKTGSVPRSYVVQGAVSVSANASEVEVYTDGKKTSTLKVDYEPKTAAINASANVVAVGGDDMKVHVYSLSGGNLTESCVLEGHRALPSAMSFSPDGKWLTSGDSNRVIILWDMEQKKLSNNTWCFHSGRIMSLAFSPDSAHVVSGSIDASVIVWTVGSKTKRIVMRGAHPGGCLRVAWIDNNTVISAGQDSNIKSWDLTY